MFTEMVDELLELSNSARDDQLRSLVLDGRRLDATVALNVAVGFNRQIHLDDGHRSMKSYLRATCNWSPAQVNRVCRAAKLIDTFPDVCEAWMAGNIGSDQVDVLARAFAHPRAGSHLADFVPVLLEHAEHLVFEDFRLCVDRFVLLADVDGSHVESDQVEGERTARVTPVGDGGVDILVTGGNAVSTAEFVAIFEQALQDQFRADVEKRRELHGDAADQHPLPRTSGQRRHDAILSIFRSYVTVPADGKRPEPIVNIICDAETFEDSLRRHGLAVDDAECNERDGRVVIGDGLGAELIDDAPDLIDRHCETTSGVVVHPDDMLRAALTGHVRRVVVDAAGVVIDLGRVQRLFTGSSRTAAQLLVRRCSHPGCTIPATVCDVDHMQGWVAEFGRTDQHNADARCQPHDRFKHRERLRTRRAKNKRIYTIRNDGTIMLPVGEREPEFYDDWDDSAFLATQTRIARGRLHALLPATAS